MLRARQIIQHSSIPVGVLSKAHLAYEDFDNTVNMRNVQCFGDGR